MDFVKKAVGGSGGDSAENKDQQKAASGDQDYVDKAFDMATKKSGHNIGRDTQEKITDAGRTAYEKATGSKVNPKISN